MSLLPSRSDASPSEDAGPRVVDVDSDEAEVVLSALSSETARELLSALYDDPATPSALADRVDTTLQNAQYHLGNLEEAGAIEVVDTAYSEKGREMDVYAPADQPLVIFAGDDENESGLRTALSRLLGAVGLLAVASVAVQRLFGSGGPLGTDTDDAAAGGSAAPGPAGNASTATPASAQGDTPTGNVTLTSKDGTQVDATNVTAETTETPGGGAETPTNVTETVDPETTTAAADATREVTAALPPGLFFFLGGLFALTAIVLVLYLRR